MIKPRPPCGSTPDILYRTLICWNGSLCFQHLGKHGLDGMHQWAFTVECGWGCLMCGGLWRSAKDFFRILTEPEHNMIRQQQALLATEGVELSFTDAAIRKVSQVRGQSGKGASPCNCRHAPAAFNILGRPAIGFHHSL